MKLVLHIVRKDFRHLLVYLVGWLGLSIVSPFVVTLEFHLQSFSFVLIAVLKIVLLAMIVSSLVHSDSLVGSRSFWLSRPVSATQLLAAKSFFLAGTLILPTILVEVLILLFNGVTVSDILRSIPESLFYILVPIAILMVLAALTRNLLQMLALALVAVVAMILFAMVLMGIFGSSARLPVDPMARVTLQSSKWIGFFLCLTVTAGIVVCFQFLTRRTKPNVILTFSALFPCILLPTQLWTWDLVAEIRKPERTVVDPEGITARIDYPSLRFYQGASTSLRDKRLVLHGNIVVEGHAPDLIVVPFHVRSSASFGFGNIGYGVSDENRYEEQNLFRSGDVGIIGSDLDAWRVEVIEKALGGDRLFASDYRLESGYVPKFIEIPEEDYERHLVTVGKLSFQIDFLFQKIEITPLAMEAGARYRRGSDQAEVLEVTFQGKGKKVMDISIRESNHMLLPDRPNFRWYVLRNRSRGEALLGNEYNSNLFGIVPFILPTLSFNHLRLDFLPPTIDPSYGPEWFDGAELLRIDISYLGAVSKSIQMHDFVMNQIPGP